MQRASVNLNKLVFFYQHGIKTSFIDDANNNEYIEKPLRVSETEVAFSVILPLKSG